MTCKSVFWKPFVQNLRLAAVVESIDIHHVYKGGDGRQKLVPIGPVTPRNWSGDSQEGLEDVTGSLGGVAYAARSPGTSKLCKMEISDWSN